MTAAHSNPNQPTRDQALLLMAKLQTPTTVHHLVSRSQLLERIDQGLEKRLTLICGSAGSGKTALLADWFQASHHNAMPAAWVSLDEGDNDPERFWRYIYTALEQIHQNLGEQLFLLLQSSSSTSLTMLTRLTNLLAKDARPFVLVLDEYHLITNESLHQALAFLLKHMPAHMHLMLLTRFEPPLSLARLRAQGQVMEIREADLRFTLEDTRRFFAAANLPFAPEHIESVVKRTEGWAAGLQLAALALRGHPDVETFMTSFTGSSRYIVDYLLEEVIGRQSDEVQTFLLSTAILGRLCASLCASVLSSQQPFLDARYHCQELLEYLERTNLFLVPLDLERRWYRYHHLFAEALQARLDLLHPSLIAELHGRASRWFEQQGLLSEAIEHALAARDFPQACHLIETLTLTFVLPVSQWTLLRWLQAVPEQAIRSSARLCFMKAWGLILSGSTQWAVIEQWIEEGLQSFPQDQPAPDELLGEALAMRATAAAFRGETEQTIRLAKQGVQLLPASHWLQGVLLVFLDSTFSLTNSLKDATHALAHLFADEGEPMRALLAQLHPPEPHLQTAIQSILTASSGHATEVLVEGSTVAPRSSAQPLLDPLSERELEVLQHMAAGDTNATIAQQLVIAPATVKRHLSNIFSKLAVANRTQAVAQARHMGIL